MSAPQRAVVPCPGSDGWAVVGDAVALWSDRPPPAPVVDAVLAGSGLDHVAASLPPDDPTDVAALTRDGALIRMLTRGRGVVRDADGRTHRSPDGVRPLPEESVGPWRLGAGRLRRGERADGPGRLEAGTLAVNSLWVRPVAVTAAPAAAATLPPPDLAGVGADPGTPGPPVVVVLPDGTRWPVREHLVVGRAPVELRPGSPEVAVTLDDPDRGLSRRHLVLRPEGPGAVAEDAGSTNGTTVRLPDGTERHLAPAAPHLLLPGSRLLLGGVELAVEAP